MPLFMRITAFTASYLVRRTGADWKPIALPTLVWINTIVLLAGSVTMEFARRSRAQDRWTWLAATTFLGFLFLAGQVFAWIRLADAGVFLQSSPHASFFYMLTAVHGAHLLGGLAALAFALRRPDLAGKCALYWHFLGAVWVWLLVLLWAI